MSKPTEPIPLTTPVPVEPWTGKLRYGPPIVLMGSCFTEHIGDRLQRYLYTINVNPFGILYNPASMARALRRIVDRAVYSADELVLQDGLYHSMDHHGAFSGADAGRVVAGINDALLAAHDALANAQAVFISPGTAWAFTYARSHAVAGTCHKIPASQFHRHLLSVDDCVHAFADIRQQIRRVNPSAAICWTISPVRHLRDGLHGNNVSKATLLLAIDSIMARHPDTSYFPAYEILQDELRDYRFYDADMAHPSPLAIDILWGRFAATCLHPDDRQHHAEIEKLRKAEAHRFIHEQPSAVRDFATRHLARIDALARRLPACDWQPLRLHFFRLEEPD